MAEIAPFRGLRYDTSVIGKLDDVVSPPYDVISPDDRVYYHQLHPCNFVRLVLGEEFDSDNDSENRFTRARRYLDKWISDGALKQDERPAIYVYQQLFERRGPRSVRGFVCAVKLHEYSEGVILPHENTLAKPKSQLGRLIRETRANLDSIYGLYSDEDCELNAVMDAAAADAPDAEAVDRDGVVHRLWVVNDPGQISTVAQFMADSQVAIADGHHRYETALAYRNEMRQRCGHDRELPSDYTLMTLVNVHEKDMTVFPTHRVVSGLAEVTVSGLEECWGSLFEAVDSTRETLTADMAARRAIGVYRRGRARTLRLTTDPEGVLEGSPASRRLELNVLHSLILERCLGIDEDMLRNQTHVAYTRDADEAMSLVDSGAHQLAFLLNEIEVKSVLEIASAGERMPQKATYFYPKLLSGLVLRRMD